MICGPASRPRFRFIIAFSSSHLALDSYPIDEPCTTLPFMPYHRVGFGLFLSLCSVVTIVGCSARGVEDPAGTTVPDAESPVDAGADVVEDMADIDEPADEDAFVALDVSSEQGPWDPDSACATTVAEAPTYPLPVDIIWVVDNSASMKPAIDELTQGLNDFANLVASTTIDFRVIMLSLRSKINPVTLPVGKRYGVCIPPPLAGDDDCGNGQRYFQSSIDIRSTQPLEQFLGTLDQTQGYAEGEERGGEPWAQWLRPEATKSIVVVTDDNSRLSASYFETFPGGTNPNNSKYVLPPGILHASRGAVFEDYLFHGLYGWGDDTDPGVKCTYPDRKQPPSSGPTYTELVQKTGGVRAKICDGATAWTPFFESIAQAVIATSKIDCEFEIPPPDDGPINPAAVNVRIVDDQPNGQEQEIPVFKVAGPQACDASGGWYYDDESDPKRVILCPASCDVAQSVVGVEKNGRIEVAYGCPTEVK